MYVRMHVYEHIYIYTRIAHICVSLIAYVHISPSTEGHGSADGALRIGHVKSETFSKPLDFTITIAITSTITITITSAFTITVTITIRDRLATAVSWRERGSCCQRFAAATLRDCRLFPKCPSTQRYLPKPTTTIPSIETLNTHHVWVLWTLRGC